MTEFALVAPLFVLLVIWSQFFVDLGIVRLKADEAARYALWENTAQRQPAQIRQEISERFRDLASPRTIQRPSPVGARSFPNANFSVQVQDNLDARIDARVNLPTGLNNGVIGFILGYAQGLINQAISSIFSRFGFSQQGAAAAQVNVQVQNTLFPSGRIFNIFFDAGRAEGNLTVRSNSPTLVVDTWKAWPGKYRSGTGGSRRDVNIDVYTTYPDPERNVVSSVEREVASVVSRGAFWGQGQGIISSISGVLSYIAGNDILASGTWESSWRRAGPVAILPADQPRHSFVPGYGVANQRIGGHRSTRHTNRGWVRGNQVRYPQRTADGDLGSNTVDRSRFTVPYRINTVNWMGLGGANNNGRPSVAPIPGVNAPLRNPYVRAMDCRDVFYMGSSQPQLSSWNENYNFRAYRNCL